MMEIGYAIDAEIQVNHESVTLSRVMDDII